MKTCIIVLILITALAASAAIWISGSVTDQKGEAVPACNVYMKGIYDGTSTIALASVAFRVKADKGTDF